jgi:sigma-B regulation protein RsbU (phosphoserine phosphatase)
MLPKRSPRIEGAEIAGWCMYSEMLGGDFFDYHDFSGICCPSPERLRIVIGDASGHGLCSALLMTSARAYLRARAMQPGDLGQVMTDVNRSLHLDLESSGHFVTAFYASVSGPERKIEWVRAGQDPALIYNPVTDRFDSLNGKGMALGVDPNVAYPASSRSDLPRGSIVFIATDGLWETKNDGKRTFGKESLKALIRQHRQESAAYLVAAVKQAVSGFYRNSKADDDMTLVAVKFV